MDWTYYEVLDLPQDADAEQIRRAYRSKVRVVHPDTGGDSGLFQVINRAYETLRDPERRQAYDNTLAGARPERRAPASREEKVRLATEALASLRARQARERLFKAARAHQQMQWASQFCRYLPAGTPGSGGKPMPWETRVKTELVALRYLRPDLFTPQVNVRAIRAQLRTHRAAAAAAVHKLHRPWWLWVTPAVTFALILASRLQPGAPVSQSLSVVEVAVMVSAATFLLHQLRAFVAPMHPLEMPTTWLAVLTSQSANPLASRVAGLVLATQALGVLVLGVLPSPMSPASARGWRAWLVELREAAKTPALVRRLLVGELQPTHYDSWL